MKVQMIPLRQIVPDELNPAAVDPAIVKVLMDDVKRNGPENFDPVRVRRLPRKELAQLPASLRRRILFKLYDGRKRFIAFSKAGVRKIRSEIYDLDESAMRILAYIKNRERGLSFDAFKEAELFAAESGPGKPKTYRQVAKAFNVSETYVVNRVSLLNITGSVRSKTEKLPHGRILPSFLEAIARVKTPEGQESLFQEILARNLTLDEAERQASNLNRIHAMFDRRALGHVPDRNESALREKAEVAEMQAKQGLQVADQVLSGRIGEPETEGQATVVFSKPIQFDAALIEPLELVARGVCPRCLETVEVPNPELFGVVKNPSHWKDRLRAELIRVELKEIASGST